MYAIVQHGGHQYRVEPGKTVEIERIEAVAGDTVTFDQVLFLGGETTKVGAPTVAGATVRATVVGEMKGDKILVQKYKPKSRYKIRTGHRQRYTQLKVDAITA
ncbi:MAG: 50S ribosomal protein L21 [Ardenticatenales bacterium]|nr:50S ribosomal protein L21 [Ardenticatenales bacterium]